MPTSGANCASSRRARRSRAAALFSTSIKEKFLELLPNRITQVKTDERDGYRAVQVTYGERRPQLLSKAIAGQSRHNRSRE